MIFTFPVTITDVFERVLNKSSGSDDRTSTFDPNKAGWYIQLDHTISIYVGMEKPDLKPGDKMKMKLERSQ